MAVAYDATGNGGVGINSSTTPLTWTHVNGGNCIIVGITFEYYNTNQITSVTYGGVSISFLGYVPSDNQGNGGGVSLYGLQGATVPGGSNTVSVAFDEPYDAIGGSVSYSGAGGAVCRYHELRQQQLHRKRRDYHAHWRHPYCGGMFRYVRRYLGGYRRQLALVS